MDASRQPLLLPTFPLDEQELHRRQWERLVRSPGLLVSAAAANFVQGCARLKVPLLSAAVWRLGKGLCQYWQRKEAELQAEVMHAMIRDSNREQDRTLQSFMRQLRSEGYHQYAVCLGQFLLLKQRLESELHADGQLSQRQEDVEILVDSLCSSVCEQLTQLQQIDGQLGEALTARTDTLLTQLTSSEQACHQRIQHAYQTLLETTERLDAILSPGKTDARQQQMEELDQLIAQLREENEVALAVDRQLRQIEDAARRHA